MGEMSKSFQSRLIDDNTRATHLVELTARIERRLYQSLVYLSAVKDVEDEIVGSITMDGPNFEILSKSFNAEVDAINGNIVELEQLLIGNSDIDFAGELDDLQTFKSRFEIYRTLSSDWLESRPNNSGPSAEVFTTSINPYFRSNIISHISAMRENAVLRQMQDNQEVWTYFRKMDLTIQLAGIFFLLITVITAFSLNRHIINPLKQLIDGTNRIGIGDLDEKITLRRTDEIGQLAEAFNQMAANLKKRTLARDYLDSIIESIHETLIMTDEFGVIVGANRSATDLVGYSKEELIGMPITELFNPNMLQETIIVNTEGRGAFEYSIQTKTGDQIPVLYSESDLINSSTQLVGRVIVATNITDRKKANERIRQSLEEKEILLAEIHHRVKNNLAVISGILQLQSYSTDDVEVMKALNESQARIKSIALVHEKLYQSDTMAYIEYNKYVAELLNEISNIDFGDRSKIEIHTNVGSFSLDLNVAVPCSLLLNELVMQRLEEASHLETHGTLWVSINEVDSNIELVVEDNFDVSQVNEPDASDSLSDTLINTLNKQLHGVYSVIPNDNGIGKKSIVKFPKSGI